jgi:hypothetical protein
LNSEIKHRIRGLSAAAFHFLSGGTLTVIGLCVLLVLTIGGTVYQVEHGLYQAQKDYFQSWIVLLFGFLPFPGGQLTLWALTVNLALSSTFRLKRTLRALGLHIIHWGLILLLVGSFVSYRFGQESQVTFFEGELANVSIDYRLWELAAWSEADPARLVSAVDFDGLSAGSKVALGALPIVIRAAYPNARATAYGLEAVKGGKPEQRLPGALLSLPNDVLLPVWAGNEYQEIIVDGVSYRIALRRIRYPLPFSIRLLEFKKETHTGTSMAKSYESLVEINQGGVARQVRIYMNHPLREAGLTFYQSSYAEDHGRKSSTLAVVRNVGWWLPYASSALIFLGMLAHFISMFYRKVLRRESSD